MAYVCFDDENQQWFFRAEHFVAFLRRFVEYLKTRINVRSVVSQNPTSFLQDVSNSVAIDAKTLRCAHFSFCFVLVLFSPPWYCFHRIGIYIVLIFFPPSWCCFHRFGMVVTVSVSSLYWCCFHHLCIVFTVHLRHVRIHALSIYTQHVYHCSCFSQYIG